MLVSMTLWFLMFTSNTPEVATPTTNPIRVFKPRDDCIEIRDRLRTEEDLKVFTIECVPVTVTFRPPTQ